MANCANDKVAFFQIYSVSHDLEQSKKSGYLRQTTREAPYWRSIRMDWLIYVDQQIFAGGRYKILPGELHL